MTGVEIALAMLTIVMVVGAGVIWSKIKSWKAVACWAASLVAVAYWLGLIR